ncbi:cysteine desulfurase family protein [uncultured Methylovirgula sp.]|uniref:cysteine desulfurase family protein n=1 Tax=uncultured Methylovirgula sp. TaxID=1285960 RepID=UPI00263465AB|nr:cysteine desulfurase family protein [uncultured Methylovirgula sp.]
MTRARAYLDHNATTPLRPAAREAMVAALGQGGNASSVHREGRHARALIEAARESLARFVKTQPKNVYFTSGATEALNLALTPGLELDGNKAPFDVLLVSAGEHAGVLQGHRFPAAAVEKLPLTPDGVLDLAALDTALARHAGRRVLLALQAANNETGVLQPVAAAAGRVQAAGGALVCDAVQAAGKAACDFAALGADILVLSAHKIGGPQGAGALCFAAGRHHIADTIVRGGGQERGLRAGTENVAAIAGFAAATESLAEAGAIEIARSAKLRDRLERDVLVSAPDVVFFGAGVARLPNTANFAVPGVGAEVLLMALDLEGVAVSSGSACSSGKVKRSHVLEAMSVPSALAEGAIRVSFGWSSKEDDVDMFRIAFAKAVETIRSKRVKPAA